MVIGFLLMGAIRTTAELRAQGLGSAERARKVRTGELHHLRRGVYAEPEAVADAIERHRALVLATLPMLASGVVVSHWSAAVLHRLPLLDPPPSRVQVTRPAARAGKNRGGIHLHAAGLAEGEVVLVDGAATTSLARTVVDLARSSPVESAVVTGDAALARLGTREALQDALEESARRPGVGRARHAVGLLDGRAESPGESLSRLLLRDLGLPAEPEPQLTVRDPYGKVVARCDFGWADLGVVGEFDGRIKYGRALAAGGRAEQAVFERVGPRGPAARPRLGGRPLDLGRSAAAGGDPRSTPAGLRAGCGPTLNPSGHLAPVPAGARTPQGFRVRGGGRPYGPRGGRAGGRGPGRASP